MSAAKDFTPAQAAQWVAQEAAKHTTNQSRLDRILSEEGFMEMLDAYGMAGRLPVSEQAHHDLIRKLKDELK